MKEKGKERKPLIVLSLLEYKGEKTENIGKGERGRREKEILEKKKKQIH